MVEADGGVAVLAGCQVEPDVAAGVDMAPQHLGFATSVCSRSTAD